MFKSHDSRGNLFVLHLLPEVFQENILQSQDCESLRVTENLCQNVMPWKLETAPSVPGKKQPGAER